MNMKEIVVGFKLDPTYPDLDCKDVVIELSDAETLLAINWEGNRLYIPWSGIFRLLSEIYKEMEK